MIVGVAAIPQPAISGVRGVLGGEGAHLPGQFPDRSPVTALPCARSSRFYPPVFWVPFTLFPSGISRDEFPLNVLIELVQVDVTEEGGQHSALRGSAEGLMIDPVVQVPGFQHVADQPEESVIMNVFREYTDKNIVVVFPETLPDISP